MRGEREVGGAGAGESADGRVAEAADAVAVCALQVEIGECVGVEPLRGGAVRGVERDTGELVRACFADGGEDVGVGGIDRLLIGREEWAGLQDGDAGELPAADDAIDRTAGGKPAAIAAEGQIVEPCGEEAMAAIVHYVCRSRGRDGSDR